MIHLRCRLSLLGNAEREREAIPKADATNQVTLRSAFNSGWVFFGWAIRFGAVSFGVADALWDPALPIFECAFGTGSEHDSAKAVWRSMDPSTPTTPIPNPKRI